MKFIKHPICVKYNKGLSLVEVMIAITITLILMAGISQLYLSNKQAYRTIEAMSRLQENARFAMMFISDSVRQAGHVECNSRKNNAFDPITATNNDISVLGIATDSLILSNAAGNAMNLSSKIIQGATTISMVNADAFNGETEDGAGDGDVVIISDCGSMQSVKIKSITNDVLTLDISNTAEFDRVLKAYPRTTVASRRVASTYAIAENNEGIPTLQRDGEDLVEGVENMQILLGEDTNSDGVPERYVDSDSVGDMANVVSIRLTLTLRTIADNVALNNRTAGDITNKSIAKDYTTTIALRNLLD